METKYYDYKLVIPIRTTDPVKIRRDSTSIWQLYTEEQQRALSQIVHAFIENAEVFIVNGVYLGVGDEPIWNFQNTIKED